MTDRKKALDTLMNDINAKKPYKMGMYMDAFPEDYTLAYKADRGSLDAAKSLHNEVLLGWKAQVTIHRQGMADVYITKDPTLPKPILFTARCMDNPARAWLIAIIKALIAKGQNT